jgi:hypothetical protein
MHCNVLPDELQHHTLLLGHSLPQKYFSKKYAPPATNSCEQEFSFSMRTFKRSTLSGNKATPPYLWTGR